MKKYILTTALCIASLSAFAQVNFKVQTACHPDDVKNYDTERLRSAFLMEKVMAPDEINLTYTLYDRLIYGGAMPVNKTLVLETFDELKADIVKNLEDRKAKESDANLDDQIAEKLAAIREASCAAVSGGGNVRILIEQLILKLCRN